MNNGVVSVTLWSATGSNVCEVCVAGGDDV